MLSKVLSLMLLCVTLAGCGASDRDLIVECEGQRRLLRGNVGAPLPGVRQAEQARSERFELSGRKLEGLHGCSVWNAAEIRCAHSKPDGTFARSFVLDREAMRVRDEVFTRGRTLTEQTTFEGECRAL